MLIWVSIPCGHICFLSKIGTGVMDTNYSYDLIASQVKLTQRERKIVEFLKNNEDSLLNDTITEFSEKAGVSDATMVRFCKHLGYKGYQDFKMHVARDMIPKERQYNPSLGKEDDSSSICSKIFNNELSVLSRTLLETDIKVLEQIVDHLYAAEKIVIFGTGGSLNVAKDALHKFMKIGLMPYVYEDIDLQLMAASLLSEKDAALVISHSGGNLRTLRCLEIAKAAGAYTMALTGLGKNPISKAADLTVHIASEKMIFQSESVSTRIAQLAILDTIAAMAAFRDYERSNEAMEATRQATSHTKF